MVTGAIAYRELKLNDPAALARVIALLHEHPQYTTKWLPQLQEVEEADRDLFLLMLAARWADDVRGHPTFHHDVWHYINYPYRPPSLETAKPEGENAVDALEQNRATVKTNPDPVAKAVALCWVMHLTGDLHQPLHTTQIFDATFPEGDKGGTQSYIRAEAGGSPISLHSLWDGLVLGSDRFQPVRTTAIELVNRPDLQRGQFTAALKETSPEKWARLESFPLCVQAVYAEGKLAESSTKAGAQPVSPEYLAQAKQTAERQLTLSAYRLADSLRHLVQP